MGKFKFKFLILFFLLSYSKPSASKNIVRLVDIFNRYQNSVVKIISENTFGTGFLIDENNVLTNAHSILSKPPFLIGEVIYTIRFNKQNERLGYLIAYDVGMDLALIRLDKPAVQTPIPRSSRRNPPKGERVFAFGTSFGMEKTLIQGTLIKKVKSKLDFFTQHYEIDLPIDERNSGGPLIDKYGQWIGVNALASYQGRKKFFAVSGKTVQLFLKTAGYQNIKKYSLKINCSICPKETRMILQKIRLAKIKKFKLKNIEANDGSTFSDQIFGTQVLFSKLQNLKVPSGKYRLYVFEKESQKGFKKDRLSIPKVKKVNISHLKTEFSSKKEFPSEKAMADVLKKTEEPRTSKILKSKKDLSLLPTALLSFSSTVLISSNASKKTILRIGAELKLYTNFVVFQRIYWGAAVKYLAFSQTEGNNKFLKVDHLFIYGSARIHWSLQNGALFLPIGNLGVEIRENGEQELYASGGIGYEFSIGSGKFGVPLEVELGSVFGFSIGIAVHF